MRRRIFIAVNLPRDVKKQLILKTKKWSDLPIHWTSEDNLHITLLFLGHIDDQSLLSVCESIKTVAATIEPLEIHLHEIAIGPSASRPRLIWAVGQENADLKNLVLKIEKSFGMTTANKKRFRPHVTLGRIRREKWKNINPAPQIYEKTHLLAPISEVFVLESVLEDGRRKYLPIESCLLGE